MFFKVLKWDLKSQRKIFVLFFLYIVSIINVAIADVLNVGWLLGIFMALHFILSALVVSIPIILLAINYYNDFYGKNSYTMHQLAVKTSTIFKAKILSGIIYTLLSVVLFGFGLLTVNSIFNGFGSTQEILSVIGEAFRAFALLPTYIENVNSFAFWLFIIVSVAIALFFAQIFYAFVITFAKGGLLRRFGKVGMVISLIVSYVGVLMLMMVSSKYLPFSIVIEKTSYMLYKVSFFADSFANVVARLGEERVIEFPITIFLIYIIFSTLGYIYVSYALNNQKSVE